MMDGLRHRLARVARERVLPPYARYRRLARRCALPPEAAGEEIVRRWSAGRFFFTAADGESGPRRYRERFGAAAVEAAVSEAEAILGHELDVPGIGRRALGDRLPWRCDPSSGRQWPCEEWPRLTPVYGDGSDLRRLWEINRFHHLLPLGKVWWLIGDPRLAAEFRAQVEDWLEDNPTGRGPNWLSPMEAAVRAMNWTAACAFFAGCPDLPAPFWRRLAAGLWEHARQLLERLEIRVDRRGRMVNNNHILSDLAGLIFLGLFFRDDSRAARWLAWAAEDLGREARRQVLADGGDGEASTGYHRYVLELLTYAYCLLARNGLPPAAARLASLHRMFRFTAGLLTPAGTLPQVGDGDDGVPLAWCGRRETGSRDCRPLLEIGGRLFGDAELARSAGVPGEGAFFLFDAGGWDPGFGDGAAPPPGKLPGAFADSGLFTLRGGGAYLLVTAGRVGSGGTGGHKHNDVLGFELWVDGEPLVVDPGTFAYTADPRLRFWFRSTAGHSTLQPEEQEMNRLPEEGFFGMEERAFPRLLEWRDGDEPLFEGAHFGFRAAGERIVHRRRFRLCREPLFVLVEDRLEAGDGRGAGPRGRAGAGRALRVRSRFHLPSGVGEVASRIEPLPVGVQRVLERWGSAAVETGCPGAEATLSSGRRVLFRPVAGGELQQSVEGGWVSPAYGRREEAPVVVFEGRQGLPIHLAVLILPGPAAGEGWR